MKAGNEIGIEGTRSLSEVLKVNTTLATLDLRGVQCNAINATPKNEMTLAKQKATGSVLKGHGH